MTLVLEPKALSPVPLAVLVVACAATLLTLPAHAQSDWPSTHYGLFIECRTALNVKAVADATRAGLGPSAMPIDMEAKDAKREAHGGSVSFSGTGVFQPDALLDVKLRVGYRCAGDPAAQQIREVGYHVVGNDGQPLNVDPSAFARDMKYLEACRDALDEKVSSEAHGHGLPAGGASVRVDPTSATVTSAGTTTDMGGQGQIQLGKDYNWVPMTFACRYDNKKKKVVKASYARDQRAPVADLAPDKQAALVDCQRAVEQAIQDDALRRGYRFTWRDGAVVWTRKGAAFSESGGLVEIKGQGEFKLDASHRQSTPMTYACAYDPAVRRVVSATFEPQEGSRTPSGEIASGRTATLVCESRNNVQKVCAAPIKGSVRIIRQLSSTECVSYSNWIWSLSGITVWGGCRAEFEFETR